MTPAYTGLLTPCGGHLQPTDGRPHPEDWRCLLTARGRVLEGRLPGQDTVVWTGEAIVKDGVLDADIWTRQGMGFRVHGTLTDEGYVLTADVLVTDQIALPWVDDDKIVVKTGSAA